MPSWILVAFVACLLVLPILLRVFVGDEPDNRFEHHQDDRDGEAEARAVAGA